MVSPTNNSFLEFSQFVVDKSPDTFSLVNKLLPKHSIKEVKINGDEFTLTLDDKKGNQGKISSQFKKNINGTSVLFNQTVKGKIEGDKITFESGSVKGKKMISASVLSMKMIKKDSQGKDMEVTIQSLGKKITAYVRSSDILSIDIDWKR